LRLTSGPRQLDLPLDLEVKSEPGPIVIDTFPKAIAAGGGDEDKARDQGVAFTHLQRIKDLRPVHIALVGHTGKDETRGARGSSAWLGDVDVMVQIGGTDVRTATVMKANDTAEGPLGSFRAEIVDLGLDEDRDPVEVRIAVPVPVDGVRVGNPSRQKDPTPAAKIARQALTYALSEVGETAPASNHIPTGVRAVSLPTTRRLRLQLSSVR
jgi:hypothetical protein